MSCRNCGETVEVCGEIRRETASAYLLFDGAREGWIPKSLIEVERTAGGRGPDLPVTVSMPEWLAIAKGFA